MNRRRFVGGIALALVAVRGASAAEGSTTVAVTGRVAQPTRFTVADLAGRSC